MTEPDGVTFMDGHPDSTERLMRCSDENVISTITQDSKKKSIIESLADVVISFAMYLPINFFVLPMFAEDIVNQEIMGFLQITVIFSMVAFVRKYAIRRLFQRIRF